MTSAPRLLAVPLACCALTAGAIAMPIAYRPHHHHHHRHHGPCGWRKHPPKHYKHVIWIVFENTSAGQVYGSSRAPYMNRLARECGKALNMHAMFHPSTPNYLAMTSGSNDRIWGDTNPNHQVHANNIFHEVARHHRHWSQYSSLMPGDCVTHDAGRYAAHHEPAPYYADLRRSCYHYDEELLRGGRNPCYSRSPRGCPDTRHGALAWALRHEKLHAFTFIGPADPETDLPLADIFLQRWMTKILGSREYHAGRTAIFITWDENSDFGAPGPKVPIPTILVAPSIPRGRTSGTWFSHYSMLRTTEQMLHLPYLGRAKYAASMRAAFHW